MFQGHLMSFVANLTYDVYTYFIFSWNLETRTSDNMLYALDTERLLRVFYVKEEKKHPQIP